MSMDYGYFDGACEPVNPGGHGGWGFVLFDAAGDVLQEGCGHLGSGPSISNNVAEYHAAYEAVQAYAALGRPGPLRLYGDSQLVIKQVSGQYAVRSGLYVPTYQRLMKALASSPVTIHWSWVPREQNTKADDLSKRALVEAGVTITKRRKS